VKTARFFSIVFLSAFMLQSVCIAQHLRIFACAIANDSAGASMGGSSNGSGLYQSDDTGKTWKHLGWDNIKCYSMDMAQSSNGRILYEATGLGVLRSTDYGARWKQLTDWRISEVMDVAVNQKKPEEIYVATAHGAWRTEDEGKTWKRIHAKDTEFVRGIQESFNNHVFFDDWAHLIEEDSTSKRIQEVTTISKFAISEIEIDTRRTFPRLNVDWCSADDPRIIGENYDNIEIRSYITGGPRGLEEGYRFRPNDTSNYLIDTTDRNVTSLLFAGDNLLIGSLDFGLLISHLSGESWISGKKQIELPHRQIWTLKSFLVTP
jgi:hypothetical protein